MAEGIIFNIQKFCVNDGPGIRTTVFLKGCPLKCIWCHNPESQSAAAELFFDAGKCTLCRRCASRCSRDGHRFQEDTHLLDRSVCIACGQCAKNCPSGALESVGYPITPEAALEQVLRDKLFYETSGGGMTVSGGEPMHQFAFTLELLKQAKAAGLHTCMETCGFANPDRLREIAEFVDIFLFDYKETDPERHREFTGVSNESILQNLVMLDRMGAATILRCPIIPGYNDREGHFAGIAALAESLQNVQEINIEPYHPLGQSKSEAIGEEYALAGLSFPKEDLVKEWMDCVQANTRVPVRKA